MKKILIIDESTFSRVCSAILRLEGYETEVRKGIGKLPEGDECGKFGLVITSYPFRSTILEKIKKIDLPKIILTDHVNREIVNLLKNIPLSFCMIRPLDYRKFRDIVREIVTRGPSAMDGYSLL